jgi:3-oxoacyl-[acyl-carrier protein] reductase
MSAVRLIREALLALRSVMAKTIASDVAPYGITVNNIAPGPIMTNRLTEILSARAKILGITPSEQFKRLSETIPARRMGRPNEIGDLCAYLCSLQAGYLTGQTIIVDGGINRSI